jgi:hypothetical protein
MSNKIFIHIYCKLNWPIRFMFYIILRLDAWACYVKCSGLIVYYNQIQRLLEFFLCAKLIKHFILWFCELITFMAKIQSSLFNLVLFNENRILIVAKVNPNLIPTMSRFRQMVPIALSLKTGSLLERKCFPLK